MKPDDPTDIHREPTASERRHERDGFFAKLPDAELPPTLTKPSASLIPAKPKQKSLLGRRPTEED
jgi:hypothetical protein